MSWRKHAKSLAIRFFREQGGATPSLRDILASRDRMTEEK
jgi:hypothetical protein